jgi:hypothetical protein
MRFVCVNLISVKISAIFTRIRLIMTKEYDGRAIVATHSTLKWIVIIGVTIGAIGLLIYWFNSPFVGSIIFLLGFIIFALCLISLIFLWLTEKILPQPK